MRYPRGSAEQRGAPPSIVLFTATPIVDDPEDAECLLRIVKGAGAASGAGTKEGYVSWFMDRPEALCAGVHVQKWTESKRGRPTTCTHQPEWRRSGGFEMSHM